MTRAEIHAVTKLLKLKKTAPQKNTASKLRNKMHPEHQVFFPKKEEKEHL